jgi:hypothetical protein
MAIRFQAGGALICPPSRFSEMAGLENFRSNLFSFAAELPARALLPFTRSDPPRPTPVVPLIDLRAGVKLWRARDQGDTMMCVAFAVAACLELQRHGQAFIRCPLGPVKPAPR